MDAAGIYFWQPSFISPGHRAGNANRVLTETANSVARSRSPISANAYRETNVYSGGIASVAVDLILLSLGALVTCLIARLRLRQTEL